MLTLYSTRARSFQKMGVGRGQFWWGWSVVGLIPRLLNNRLERNFGSYLKHDMNMLGWTLSNNSRYSGSISGWECPSTTTKHSTNRSDQQSLTTGSKSAKGSGFLDLGRRDAFSRDANHDKLPYVSSKAQVTSLTYQKNKSDQHYKLMSQREAEEDNGRSGPDHNPFLHPLFRCDRSRQPHTSSLTTLRVISLNYLARKTRPPPPPPPLHNSTDKRTGPPWPSLDHLQRS